MDYRLVQKMAIDVSNDKTIIFRGILRKIIVSAEDRDSFQAWVRGMRLLMKVKSIILWPFIENQNQFKSLLSNLNLSIKFVDESDEATKSGKRIFLLMLAFFLYISGLAAWLF